MRVGNNGSSGCPARSLVQTRSTACVGAVSGTARWRRPLPRQETAAPAPKVTSAQFNSTSSATRSPVWIAVSSNARSRRPSQRVMSGAAMRASICSAVRNVIVGLSNRFGGDREDLLDGGGVLGVSQRRVREQRPDRGQPQVPGASAVVTGVFAVLQERGDRGSVEIGPVESMHRPVMAVSGERDEQTHRVAIHGDRARADPSLFDQPVGEEALHRGSDHGHSSTSLSGTGVRWVSLAAA